MLGGCCTLVPGALAGARDALGECGIAYLDGHFDLYEGDTSQTGEAADFPLAAAIGRAPQALLDRVGGDAVVDPERIALLGPRDEEEAVGFGSPVPREVGITHFRDRESLRGADLATVGADAAERLAEGGRRYWLHLDVDVMDQEAFPATDVLMPDGLSVAELSELIAPLLAHEALAGVNLVCFNPEKDPGGACGDALAELTLAGLLVGGLGLVPSETATCSRASSDSCMPPSMPDSMCASRCSFFVCSTRMVDGRAPVGLGEA